MGRRESNRVYWVDFVTTVQPDLVQTARIVADGKLTRPELREKMIDHGASPHSKIVKVRSEAVD